MRCPGNSGHGHTDRTQTASANRTAATSSRSHAAPAGGGIWSRVPGCACNRNMRVPRASPSNESVYSLLPRERNQPLRGCRTQHSYRSPIIGPTGILMMGGQQIIILKEGTEREKGKGAVFNNIAAARAVADAVKSTLGPKGMDKMLVDSLGDVTITNDGVTILKEIEIEHPTAKMLVEVAKTQDDEVGDGTTSAVVLAGELLKEAESLIEQEVHPTIIVNGYRMAAAEAVRRLRQLAFDVKRTDKATLGSIARTAMSGRSVGTNADFLADIAVEAVQSIVEEVAGEVRADVDNILVQKKHGGNLKDTTLIDGIVLDKERVHPRMPKFVRDAKIALINRAPQ